jgi:hypothetical protein
VRGDGGEHTGVHAVGEKLSIPMPGHPVPAAEQPTVLQHVARLTQLVQVRVGAS